MMFGPGVHCILLVLSLVGVIFAASEGSLSVPGDLHRSHLV